MVVLNAILYSVEKENIIFLIKCECLEGISWGRTKEQAIKDLEKDVKRAFDSRKDKTKSLGPTPTSCDVRGMFGKIKLNPDKYKPEIKKIPEYAEIHVYDFIEETRGKSQRNYKMDL